MNKLNKLEANFAIRRIKSSKDPDLTQALRIYNECIPSETKTSTNEIMYFVESSDKDLREMYFFCLYYNNEVIGYIESAFLKTTKTVIIDYIVIKENYNGIYYPLFSLFQKFIFETILEVNYMITEVSMQTLENGVDKESYFSRKLLIAEDFKMINITYIQPQLGANKTESDVELRLLIKPINNINQIKSSAYWEIINDVYHNHYLNWYSHFMSEEDISNYKNALHKLQEELRDKIDSKDTIYLTKDFFDKCDYYMTSECHYTEEKVSTAGYASGYDSKKKSVLWVMGVILIIVFSSVISFLIYIVLSKLNIPTEEIHPLFSTIIGCITGLVVLFFSNKSKK